MKQKITKKKIEIQETNINGNYGRIIIQENNKESSPSQREEKIIIKKIKMKIQIMIILIIINIIFIKEI